MSTPGISIKGLPLYGFLDDGKLNNIFEKLIDAACLNGDPSHLDETEVKRLVEDEKNISLVETICGKDKCEPQEFLYKTAQFFSGQKSQIKFFAATTDNINLLKDALSSKNSPKGEMTIKNWIKLKENLEILAAYRPGDAANIVLDMLFSKKFNSFKASLLDFIEDYSLPLNEDQIWGMFDQDIETKETAIRIIISCSVNIKGLSKLVIDEAFSRCSESLWNQIERKYPPVTDERKNILLNYWTSFHNSKVIRSAFNTISSLFDKKIILEECGKIIKDPDNFLWPMAVNKFTELGIPDGQIISKIKEVFWDNDFIDNGSKILTAAKALYKLGENFDENALSHLKKLAASCIYDSVTFGALRILLKLGEIQFVKDRLSEIFANTKETDKKTDASCIQYRTAFDSSIKADVIYFLYGTELDFMIESFIGGLLESSKTRSEFYNLCGLIIGKKPQLKDKIIHILTSKPITADDIVFFVKLANINFAFGIDCLMKAAETTLDQNILYNIAEMLKSLNKNDEANNLFLKLTETTLDKKIKYKSAKQLICTKYHLEAEKILRELELSTTDDELSMKIRSDLAMIDKYKEKFNKASKDAFESTDPKSRLEAIKILIDSGLKDERICEELIIMASDVTNEDLSFNASLMLFKVGMKKEAINYLENLLRVAKNDIKDNIFASIEYFKSRMNNE